MYLSPRTSVNQPAQLLGDHEMQRGYQPLYHLDIVNRCPACGKSHWHVGRFSAECAHCETALPLAMVASQPMQPRFTEHFSKTAVAGQNLLESRTRGSGALEMPFCGYL